jgi:hypothetical protein
MNQGENHGGQMEHQECAGEVVNQSNSELTSSSLTRSPGSPRIQIDVQIAYNLRFERSTYAQKAKEITFLMTSVSCPTKIGVARNH